MSMIKEFKEFAIRGNVVDMAVGIIIGAAFGRIVTSLVNDIIMPLVGVLSGGVDFSNRMVVLKEGVGDVPATTLNYGMLVQVTINFIIVAFAIFLVVKGINSLKRKDEQKPDPVSAPPIPTKEEELLTDIRDLLAARSTP